MTSLALLVGVPALVCLLVVWACLRAASRADEQTPRGDWD